MRISVALLVAGLSIATPAYAQQEVGAGKIEVGVAAGGGALFLAASDGVSRLGQYSVGVTVTFNVNDFVGIEGDLGFGGARRQTVTIDRIPMSNQATPSAINYNGTLILNITGRHHRLFPYAAAGVGGLTMLHSTDTDQIGLTETRTFFTINTGGGVNWFPIPHVGIRGDYRFMIINVGSNAPSFLGHGDTRFAHRVYAALILSY